MKRSMLQAYAVGALDPGRRAEVEEELASSAELRDRLAEIRRELSVEGAAPRPWRMPAVGERAGPRPFEAAVRPAAVLGSPGGALRPGRRFDVALGPFGADEERVLAVLYRAPEGWRLLEPTPELARRVTDLPEDVLRPGVRVLSIEAMDDPGEQRWAVALLDPAAIRDETALAEALEAERVAVATVAVWVEPGGG